ncbi:hypothetical protein WKI68_17085 [Streptomyces sp. MS1.HAVA.3]|uniref:Uncharacterized protein n=1 Tax=Streptomyces caledonius TaxID=3134107 RepID=A0ABU8U4P0_9ACTN
MVKDSARKRAVRNAASLSGSKYTTALREVEDAQRYRPPAAAHQGHRLHLHRERGKAASLRSSYTGEDHTAAMAGVKSRGDLGLDSCTPRQQEFRALLALALLNKGRIVPAGMQWECSTFSAYDPVISSREDELVVTAARAPDNMTAWILPRRSPGWPVRVPGLRLESLLTSGHETYVLRHMPTGGRLVITSSPTGEVSPDAERSASGRDYLTVDDELTSREIEALSLAPAMTGDARRLLAGLVTRYTLEDPAGQWATSWDGTPWTVREISERNAFPSEKASSEGCGGRVTTGNCCGPAIPTLKISPRP